MVSIVHTDFYPAVNNFLLRSSGQSNLFSDLHTYVCIFSSELSKSGIVNLKID